MTPHETDQLLDRTLRALANAEPAPGFTDRLQTNLAQHGQAQHSRYRRNLAQRSLRLPSFHLALPLSLTAAVLCTVALFYSHSKLPNSKLKTQANTSNLTASTLKPQQQPNLTTNRQLATTIPSQLKTSKLTAQQEPSPTHSTSTPIQLHLLQPASPTSTVDGQALTDLRTPSFPAPPLAPTAQERLVALMLRRGEKHELAQLDPAQAEHLANAEQLALQDFFEPRMPAPLPIDFKGDLP